MVLVVKTKTKKKPVKARVAASSKARPVAVATAQETDAFYILKLVLYLIIGSQWIRITRGTMTIPLPVGVCIGLLFARSERFQIDRKIEYAILLLSMFIGFWLPLGIELVL